jgi:Protein of unknown function (DUF3710)
VRFRRRTVADGQTDDAPEAAEAPEQASAGEDETAMAGPFDSEDLPEDEPERVDLGSLLIAPQQGRELRLQVDETSGAVQSVVLAGADGALELRAFAAPRGGDLWSEARPEIAAEVSQAGGSATEREGPFGAELVCQMKVQRQGSAGAQVSRIIGVNGPRWMLRATLMGRPATEPDGSQEWEDAIRGVAVRRGSAPMPVGEALPLTMPPQARRVQS